MDIEVLRGAGRRGARNVAILSEAMLEVTGSHGYRMR
jgi:hypothetical protein